MVQSFKVAGGLVAASLVLTPLLANGQDMIPKASQIASKARAASLVKGNSVTFKQGGNTATFVPIDLRPVATADDLNGKVIGRLRTDLSKDVTGLPPGTYNVYLSKSGNTWHGYFQSGGYVFDAAHVEISQASKPTGVDPKPELGPQWHICVYDHWVCYYP